MTDSPLHNAFSRPLLQWYALYGRKNLPWQRPGDAYRIWISEIMLQQTQVQTVIPYFERFVASFPDIYSLCHADEDFVLAHWSGLGYYTRARNIHKTAKIICVRYQGQFPKEVEHLIRLPGIGPSTAGAIASLAYNLPTPILDGNVKRVLSRCFMVDGPPSSSAVVKHLWQLATQCMPKQNCAEYSQAIMDLGATCCTTKHPQCQQCPLQDTCLANKHNKVGQYPVKKIAKIRPFKSQHFLLLHTQDQLIYLEKRPPVGLWGGLWCLPVIDAELSPVSFIEKHYRMDCIHISKLPEIKHSFSHFHLRITPFAIQIQPQANTIAEKNGQWFHTHALRQLGLAKPVSQIISDFLETTNKHGRKSLLDR